MLFNRFQEADFDSEPLEDIPSLSLASSHELLLRLYWVAVLFGRAKADFAGPEGSHTGHDAPIAMITSALLKGGVGHLPTVRQEVLNWLEAPE